MTTFATRLHNLGLSQAGLARVISRLADAPVAATTVYRWASGRAAPPATAWAVLGLLERLPRDDVRALATRDHAR